MSVVDVSLAGELLSDVVPEALVTNVSRELAGARRDAFVDVPGRSGSVFFSERSGDRTLRLVLNLVADTFAQRRDAIRRLSLWAVRNSLEELIVDDEPDRYELAVLAGTPTVVEQVNYATVELEYRCGAYAYAVDVSDETATLTSGTPVAFDFPDSVEAEPTVEIELLGAAATVTVEIDGRTFVNAGTFTTGNVFTISTPGYVVVSGAIGGDAVADSYLDGYFDTTAVSMAGASGKFPVLVPGGGNVEITTDTNAGVDVRIRWRERFQ